MKTQTMHTPEREETRVVPTAQPQAKPMRAQLDDRDRQTNDAIVQPTRAAPMQPVSAPINSWLRRRLPLVVVGLALLMCATVVTIDSIV